MTRAWVEIDLGALRRNAARLSEHARVPLVPMIKADAYGLGAVRVARALEALDPWGYGVASVREGAELRAAGITRRILVVTPLLAEELDAARAAHLTPALGTRDTIALWGASEPWHLAIDTGMSRAGVHWEALHNLLDVVRENPPEGALTHFHSSELDDGSMAEQERRFRACVAALPARPRLLHADNSAAIVRHGRCEWDLVRPGIFLYGVGSGPGAALAPEPVAHVRARVVDIHGLGDGATVSYDATYRAVGARRIATTNIGYADGYRRSLSNRGTAVLRGKRVPIAGLVTMDMVMLDVTDVPCEVGDVVTFIGRDGGELLDVETVARAAELSPYEILVGLRLRLERLYLEASTEA